MSGLNNFAGEMLNPLGSQFGQLSVQDKAFLDAINRQEQMELHGVPRPVPVDPTAVLGQLEQYTLLSRMQRQGSVQSNNSSINADSGIGSMVGTGGGSSGSAPCSTTSSSSAQPRHHEIVAELEPEEVIIEFFYC